VARCGRLYSTHNQWHVVADYIAHTISGTLSCLWKIHIIFFPPPLDMLQFHNITNITKQLPDQFPPTGKTTNTELTDHQFRIQRNCVISVMWVKNVQNQKWNIWASWIKFVGHQDFFLKMRQSWEEWDKWEPQPTNIHCKEKKRTVFRISQCSVF
jgi:hypothetical protein